MNPEAAPLPQPAVPARRPERLKARQAKKVILEMLKKYPIVEAACAKAGISRSTHYEWTRKDSRYNAKVEEAMQASIDTVNDIAESNIIEGVKRKEHKSSTFWLTHRHPAYKRRDKLEDAKVQRLVLKPPPSPELVRAIRKYDPDYDPPKGPEYITTEEWQEEQRASEAISRRLEQDRKDRAGRR